MEDLGVAHHVLLIHSEEKREAEREGTERRMERWGWG